MKLLPLALIAFAAPALAQVTPAAFNPHAGELIEGNAALKKWALAKFDSNHDGWLTLFEAQPAAAAFRDIADANKDGRITVREYEAAVAFVGSRY